MDRNYKDVITFWFEDCEPEQWFTKDSELDKKIIDKFLDTYWAVVYGECSEWRKDPEGRLAEIIVLDQFSRNMFRGDPQSFLYDPMALALAQEMVCFGFDKELPLQKKQFAYMPYMHSESKKIHEEALVLFTGLGESKDFEIKHKNIIDTFGRYPHRNEVLGRESTPEELEFMKTNSGF